MELTTELQKILHSINPKAYGLSLKSKKELKERIFKVTNFLPEKSALNQRIYHILNDIEDMQVCHNCKKESARFISMHQGYAPYCSRICANSCLDKKETTQQVWIEKYGSKEARVEHVKEVHKKAMLEKTGFESNFHNPEFQKTSNGGFFAWDENTRSKRKQTCLEKYGVQHVTQSQEFKEKSKQTLENAYENGHYMRDPKVIAQREKELFDKHGVSNIAYIPFTKEKKRSTCLEKYGVYNQSQRHLTNIELWEDEYFIRKTFLNENETIKYDEMMQFLNCKSPNIIREKFKNLEIPFKHSIGYSKFEGEIKEYIQSIIPDVNIVERNRTITKPYEIDLYLPAYKLGVEFHGLTWHSFGHQPNNAFLEKQNKNTHKNKANNANGAGITLLQMFENEWHNPVTQKILKSVITAKLGLCTKLYARKCTIKEIPVTEANMFLKNNHLQQSTSGNTVNIGLILGNKLVSLMTFGKSRFTNEEYELLRFCNILNTSVIGGFPRLLKHFIIMYNPTSIISYANRRWSKGDIYENNGFEYVSITNTGYYYYHQSDTTKLFHRIKFQKHKLHALLPKFDPTLTETENMYENGYRKIYDAGQLKYVLRL